MVFLVVLHRLHGSGPICITAGFPSVGGPICIPPAFLGGFGFVCCFCGRHTLPGSIVYGRSYPWLMFLWLIRPDYGAVPWATSSLKEENWILTRPPNEHKAPSSSRTLNSNRVRHLLNDIKEKGNSHHRLSTQVHREKCVFVACLLGGCVQTRAPR